METVIAFNGPAAVRQIEQEHGLEVTRLRSEPTPEGHAFKAEGWDANGENHLVYGCQDRLGEIEVDVWPSQIEMFAGVRA